MSEDCFQVNSSLNSKPSNPALNLGNMTKDAEEAASGRDTLTSMKAEMAAMQKQIAEQAEAQRTLANEQKAATEALIEDHKKDSKIIQDLAKMMGTLMAAHKEPRVHSQRRDSEQTQATTAVAQELPNIQRPVQTQVSGGRYHTSSKDTSSKDTSAKDTSSNSNKKCHEF